jgi:hypothetical protein
VEPSEEHKAVLRVLGNGECIFRDLDDRAGRIGALKDGGVPLHSGHARAKSRA